MLEDELEDILGKAIRGQAKNLQHLGIDAASTPTAEHLKLLAKNLKLSYSSLMNLDKAFCTPSLPSSVGMYTAPFGHLGVNCFSVQYRGNSFLVDTGTDPNLIYDLEPDYLLITHDHPDHTACSSIFDCPVITAKKTSKLKEFDIQIFDVSGHYSPSVAYFFPELEKPVCFVGDSLFRRSMGGCGSEKAYRSAIINVKNMLTTLPPETILCVGHGPNTTVKEELTENPFFART